MNERTREQSQKNLNALYKLLETLEHEEHENSEASIIKNGIDAMFTYDVPAPELLAEAFAHPGTTTYARVLLLVVRDIQWIIEDITPPRVDSRIMDDLLEHRTLRELIEYYAVGLIHYDTFCIAKDIVVLERMRRVLPLSLA